MMADLEYRHKLKNKYNELVRQIAQKNLNSEDYKELLEIVRSINEQLLVLDIQYHCNEITSNNKNKQYALAYCFLILIICSSFFKIALWMCTYWTYFWSFFSVMNVSTVTTNPHFWRF